MASDYTICSEIDGVVYSIDKEIGELVTPQTAVAVIGNQSDFILEMQVDEYDITSIRLGQEVVVTMDSYKGHSFGARVSKISSLMNERTKSFKVEAVFVTQPERLFPNTSFEANIVVQTKKRALLIPRTYVLPENQVLLKSGEKKTIQVGLKDYRKVEVISGLTQKDELALPEQ
jgi:multidrug efflux pump subunit AcrA (membrane-fusion protein)